jgi:hypothetical protein
MHPAADETETPQLPYCLSLFEELNYEDISTMEREVGKATWCSIE